MASNRAMDHFTSSRAPIKRHRSKLLLAWIQHSQAEAALGCPTCQLLAREQGMIAQWCLWMIDRTKPPIGSPCKFQTYCSQPSSQPANPSATHPCQFLCCWILDQVRNQGVVQARQLNHSLRTSTQGQEREWYNRTCVGGFADGLSPMQSSFRSLLSPIASNLKSTP